MTDGVINHGQTFPPPNANRPTTFEEMFIYHVTGVALVYKIQLSGIRAMAGDGHFETETLTNSHRRDSRNMLPRPVANAAFTLRNICVPLLQMYFLAHCLSFQKGVKVFWDLNVPPIHFLLQTELPLSNSCKYLPRQQMKAKFCTFSREKWKLGNIDDSEWRENVELPRHLIFFTMSCWIHLSCNLVKFRFKFYSSP